MTSSPDLEVSEVETYFTELAALELDFEAVDVEILRETARKQAPLYERRNKITSSIPGFWPHVLDQCAETIDIQQHITPEDLDALTSLTALNVTRPDEAEPRTIEFSWTFKESVYMPAQTIVKRFEHKKGRLVSTPVEIQWKDGKDLTGGVNKAAMAAKTKEEKEKLAEMVDRNEGFFLWFSFEGQPGKEDGDDEGEDGDDEDEDAGLEVFPFGDEVAIQIAEDMYPNAVKYFTTVLEQDGSSDDEEDIEESSDEMEDLNALVSKKVKRNGADEDDLPAKKKKKV